MSKLNNKNFISFSQILFIMPVLKLSRRTVYIYIYTHTHTLLLFHPIPGHDLVLRGFAIAYWTHHTQ
jgi:hypothetical protein